MLRGLAALAAAAGLTACATLAPPADRTPPTREAQCRGYFDAADRAVAAAGTGDAAAARIAGFSYLRADRFLASYRDEVEGVRFEAWVRALGRLDAQARTVETGNLPHAARVALRAEVRTLGLPDLAPMALDEGCRAELAARDLATAADRDRLRAAAVVPDDYQTWKRMLGLYVVTRIPFAAGVRDYERGVLARFDAPLDALPAQGRRVLYVPPAAEAPSGAAAAAWLVQDARAFAAPDADAAARLLAAHAPVFDVDEALPADRIGFVQRDAGGRFRVDVSRAIVYGRVEFTRFDGRVLPQAVYTAWFPARPKTSAWDLLGGDWDAIVWRATLDEQGAPLVYDTIHACGCYHMFFPTPRLAPRPRPDTLDEWALVPQPAPELAPGDRVRLRIAARTHYLERVLVAAPAAAGMPYALAADDLLRALPGADGTSRSLYAPDGIVPGSERGERYVFWPMGIREPGAMRQWGRQATAFVGRRHFDDANLLDRHFVPR